MAYASGRTRPCWITSSSAVYGFFTGGIGDRRGKRGGILLLRSTATIRGPHSSPAKARASPTPLTELSANRSAEAIRLYSHRHADRHDAYREKLRRSVEAIQEYNAGLELSEQFSSMGSLLRELTKVRPGKVKDGTSDHTAELDSYNSGFAPRQNTGKPELRSIIKWSEQAYGQSDW